MSPHSAGHSHEMSPQPAEHSHESRVLLARASSIVFPILASIFVGMRFYVRRYIVGGIGPDDWLAMLGLVCIWVTAGMVLGGVNIGYGRHIWDVDNSSLHQLRDIITAYPIVAHISSTAVQLSILTFYRRLSPSRGFHNLCYALIVFATFSCVFHAVYTSIWCFHITPGPGFCKKARSVVLIYMILGIGLNSIIWCMPIPMLWRLKINVRKRLGLIILFSMGVIAVGAVVGKLILLKRRKKRGTDPPWVSPWFSFMYQLEVSVGIICACLPTLPPLLTQSPCFVRTQKPPPPVEVDMDGRGEEGDSGNGTKLADRASAGWDRVSLMSTWQGVQRYYHTRWGRKRSIIEVADLEGLGVLDSYPENVHPNTSRQRNHASPDMGQQISLASMPPRPAGIKSTIRPDDSGRSYNTHLQPPAPVPGNHVHTPEEMSQPVQGSIPTASQETGYTKPSYGLKSGGSIEGLLSSMTPRSELTSFTTGKTYTTSGSFT